MRTLLSYSFVLFILFISAPALANDYCVDDLSDGPVNGANCAATCDGTDDCSLRDAIAAANANSGVADIINFGVTGTITLNQGANLAVVDDLSIYGPGRSQLTIDADGGSRVFLGLASNLEIFGVTLTGGEADAGGAVGVTLGTLKIVDSTITGNNSTSPGGGVLCDGDCTILSTTISNNTAALNGGGIYNTGNLTAFNVTLSGNTAVQGGGIEVDNGGSVTLNNATLSDNQSTQHGGGIDVTNGTLSLNSVTLTNNKADSDDTNDGDGGGVYISAAGSALAQNSIIAGNTDATNVGDVHPDCSGPGTITSGGYNIVGDTTGCNGAPGTGDQVGDALDSLDPELAALADNGGLTQTHSPYPRSPVIDAGNPTACLDGAGADLVVDQREVDRVADADGDGVARCDIGAYEIRVFTVDDLGDTNDASTGNGICADASGNCTLRAAMHEARSLTGTDAIQVAVQGELAIASQLPDVDDNVIIFGPGMDSLSINGNGNDIFKVATAADPHGLVLSQVTLSNGAMAVWVRNDQYLVLDRVRLSENTDRALLLQTGSHNVIMDSEFSNNSDDGNGGAIQNSGGELLIKNSLFSGNTSQNDGGAIHNQSSAETILLNVTLSGNEANRNGGAVSNAAAELFLLNTTVTQNRADADGDNDGDGGAIRHAATGTLGVMASILSDNVKGAAGNSVASNCDGTISSGNFNVESGTDCAFGMALDLQSTDPLLGALADNGGFTMTHALLDGSPAIDRVDGDCEDEEGDALTQDQRGFFRSVDGDGDDQDGCDSGAYEVGSCGDAIIDPGEACDDGVGTNSDTVADACRTDCSDPSCGDGVTDTGEACDDGNTTDGDGCSDTCEVEVADDDTSTPDDQSNTSNDPNDSADDAASTTDDTTDDDTTTTAPAASGCSLIRR